MGSTSVDVVVLSWNDGALLDRAVASALQAASPSIDVSVVVVDNGSEPPVAEPVDPRVRLIRNDSNLGVSVARNQGLAVGSAPYVLFLDSDAELLADTLVQLLAMFDESSVGLAAPVFAGQRPQESAGRTPTLALKVARALNLRGDYDVVEEPSGDDWAIEFAIGACLLVRRTAIDAVDGFDEAYFYGPEDIDLCARLRQAGWAARQSRLAVCIHPPRRRHKNLLTRGGLAHGANVARHLWRHRRRFGSSSEPTRSVAPGRGRRPDVETPRPEHEQVAS